MDEQTASIGVVVAFMDAMGRGDRDALHELLIVAMLTEQITLRFMRHRRVEAVELIGGEKGVALGVRDATMTEIGDIALDGQLYNVFTVVDGRIVAVRDLAHRSDALAAAGARRPAWR
jgi:limonene-1,2-epoxide hydrolase